MYNKKIYKYIALILAVILAVMPLSGCVGCVGCVGCLSLLSNDDSAETSVPASQTTYSSDKYEYSTLDPEAQKVYDELYTGIVNMESEIGVSTNSEEVLTKVVECIPADYGDIFYVDGYSYYEGGFFGNYGYYVSPEYTMSREERDRTLNQIEAVANSWLSEISVEASDYEKSKWVYETLINNVDYDANAPDNQNIISVFINKKTVCQGYSCAANYLLSKLGIQSVIVPGYAEGEPHAWNLVRLDGEYYYMDVTWGNSDYTKQGQGKTVSYITLNVTTEDISKNHTVEQSFNVPECHATNDNYYIQEGCYFESFQPQKMGAVLRKGCSKGENVSIKCANKETYDQMKEYFIDEEHFVDYCSSNCLQYILYEEERVIDFDFSCD